MKTSKTIERIYWLWFAVASIIYCTAPFFTPLTEASKMRFPELAANPMLRYAVTLGVSAPILFIWASAIYGITKFKSYAYSIKESEDGKGLNTIANGLTILIVGGMVVSLSTALYNVFVSNASSPARTILMNYTNLGYNLLAFATILKGSLQLSRVVKAKDELRKNITVAVVPFLAFSGLYAWLTFHNSYRNATPDPARIASLYLPDHLILLTMVLPYILLWSMGSLSAIAIGVYQKMIKGAIYKQALSRLAIGIMLVIVFSILMQLLGTVGSAFSDFDLNGILALIFVILVIYAICFLVIASGARKLKKIEEVQ